VNDAEKKAGYKIERCTLLWGEKREEWDRERIVRVIVFNRGQTRVECMKEYLRFCINCDIENAGGREEMEWDTEKSTKENVEVEVEWAMKNTVTEEYSYTDKEEGNCLVCKYYHREKGPKETGYMIVGEEMGDQY